MLDSFLRHVTKDSYGPISFKEKTSSPAIVHKFHEGISVLNWGKMPDVILNRGKVGAAVFTELNQALQSELAWKNFLKSPEALSFRKAGTSISQSGNVSAMLNELAEVFPISSNFLGVIDEPHFKALDSKTALTVDQLLPRDQVQASLEKQAMLYPVVEYIAEEKIPHSTVMGRAVWDYSLWKKQASPKMLPFEFLCHFALTESSLKKLKIDAISLPKTASLHTLQAGVSWDFPVVELILTQDPFQKRIGLSDAIWITEWSPEKLQTTILTAAWIAAFLKYTIKGFSLNAVQLKFAVDSTGALILCDPGSLDDLHLEKNGHLFHSELALQFYQKTSWFETVVHAQKHAETFGLSEWKRLCAEPAPWMDPKFKTEFEADHLLIAKNLLGK